MTAVSSIVVGLWMFFDGCRPLLIGDYLTPASGQHAGRLGLWADALRWLGLDPRSAAVMLLHVVCGAALLAAWVALLRRAAKGSRYLLAASLLTAWYLPFSTLVAVWVAVPLLAAPVGDGGGR
ncbi:MAG: hypothetical protein DWQ36_20460 [Acidobacteria bacterium]|nr:MAG: hypothetical protein DWQ30_20885 [Acidobacteriota bacterium]REK03243.1 MAG: hypothetical protein DWQ36_20460 [Acidobacteriota bacterium]